MAIPKAVTDKLVHQESRIMGLEARIDQDGRLIAALQTSEARLQHEIDDLDNENTQLLQKLQSVEAVLNQQTRDIDRLFSLLEQKPSAQVPPDADKTKNPCDNVFNVSAAFTTI
jgi:Tfp pilus assembly protein PilN